MNDPRNKRSRIAERTLAKLSSAIDGIDPDVHYGDWVSVLMGIFNETDASEDGFELADDWSSKGKKYRSTNDVRKAWNSFKIDHDNPIMIGTLIWMARRGSK